MLSVRLTAKELSEARQIANGRSQLNRASGVVNQNRDKQRDIEYLGVCAEMAVAKALNIDGGVHILGVDDGVDMWHGDVAIDVKSTFHKTGKLLFVSHDHFKAGIAILATADDDPSVINVIGGIGRSEFIRSAEPNNLGKGQCFTLAQDKLLPIETVWLKLQQRLLQ